MDNANRNRRAFIEQLARENHEFYGTPDGRGVLRAFELTFEHSWLYLFELVQNALDAGAYSIALRLTEDGDTLIFQHNGDHPLDGKAVEALSKVFRSTKGVSSVGFMGIGFKSVFGRFREAHISGWGWTFRYEITQVVGEYGDVQPDLLGAVVPIWDGAITAPDPGFTTRFEMRRRAGSGANLKADLAHFLPDVDRTLLAILAASGLKRLEVDGRMWELDVGEESDGTMEAVAISESENRRWRLFSVEFTPSKEAIAGFLEHRRIQPSEKEREQVYAEAAGPRRVLGLLSLDDDGTPAPPARGRVYATLPTEVTLPFGLHVNADWLLNISRSGLRGIEDNPWQRDIVDRIADVLASFLDWTARTFSEEPAPAQAAFAALAPPSPEAGGLEALLAEDCWLSRLRTRLEDTAVLPVWAEETDALAFAKPGDAILPPPPLAKAFKERPALRPAILLKGPVVRDDVLGSGARDLLHRTGLLAEMSPQDFERAWPDGLARWWKTLADEQERRRELLFRVWAAVAELASEATWQDADFPCVRTATGRWLPVGRVVFFDEPFPSEREPGGPQARQFIRPFIPENRLPVGWIGALRKEAKNESGRGGPLSQARKWIEAHARHINLREVVGDAMNDLVSSPTPDWSVLTSLGHWAKDRKRPDLLIRVLVESDSGPLGVPAEEALMADPYVEDRQGRRLLFPTKPAISAAYLEQDPKKAGAREWRRKWREFFEKAGVKSKLEVRSVKKDASRWERGRVAKFLGLEVDEVDKSNDRGYELLDFDIEPGLPGLDTPEELRTALAAWLEDGRRVLEGKGKRQTRYFYRSSRDRKGNAPSAWVIKLSKLVWVPCNDGALRRPQDVLPRSDPGREDAPVAELSPELLRVLEQEGVKFGTAIPEAPSLCKLLAAGSRLDAEGLAQLLCECREQITTDEDRHYLEQVLQTLTVPAGDNRRAPLDRVVQQTGGGRRGALGGWTVPLDRIDKSLRAELEHPDFPYNKFPDTTTGEQALAYLRDVWKRARSSSEGLANEVRDVLRPRTPTAWRTVQRMFRSPNGGGRPSRRRRSSQSGNGSFWQGPMTSTSTTLMIEDSYP